MGWTGSSIGTPEWYADTTGTIKKRRGTARYSSAPASGESALIKWMWREHPQTSAFLYYAGFGLLDPKMPVEYKAFGATYVAANVLGVGAVLWYIDPHDKREGGFAESGWYDRNIRQNQWQIGAGLPDFGW